MKITTKDYNHMKNVIGQLLPYDQALEHYTVTLPADPRIKDIDKRFRWDCFYASGLSTFTATLNYLNSDHIDTALCRIVKEVFPFTSEA